MNFLENRNVKTIQAAYDYFPAIEKRARVSCIDASPFCSSVLKSRGEQSCYQRTTPLFPFPRYSSSNNAACQPPDPVHTFAYSSVRVPRLNNVGDDFGPFGKQLSSPLRFKLEILNKIFLKYHFLSLKFLLRKRER